MECYFSHYEPSEDEIVTDFKECQYYREGGIVPPYLTVGEELDEDVEKKEGGEGIDADDGCDGIADSSE